MSRQDTEIDTEPVTECPDCARIWTVADVDAVVTAKRNGNRLLFTAVLVLVVGLFAAVAVPLVGVSVVACGLGLGVWSVNINRRPLRAMTTVALDRRNKQELKRLQRKTLSLGGMMALSSMWVLAGVIYFSLTRRWGMAVFFVAALLFCWVWFAVVGFFQRRFQRTTRCPGCLDLRVAINFMPTETAEAVKHLRGA